MVMVQLIAIAFYSSFPEQRKQGVILYLQSVEQTSDKRMLKCPALASAAANTPVKNTLRVTR